MKDKKSKKLYESFIKKVKRRKQPYFAVLEFLDKENTSEFHRISSYETYNYVSERSFPCPTYEFNKVLDLLENGGYIQKYDSEKSTVIWLTIKGKNYCLEHKKIDAANALSQSALVIAIFLGCATLFFAGLDYLGDKNWQNEQLKELKALNENFKKLNIEDPETSSG